MCGIYGLASLCGAPLPAPPADWADGLRHRGPDGHGAVRGEHFVIGAHRLRIRDLTPAADQPFRDPADRLTLVVNGEIDNSDVLRRRYARYPYRSASDVEVILPLYLERGAEGLAALEGMFALALFDQARGRLLLARDPAGEKPLFWTRQGPVVGFASEPQTLLALSHVSRALDGVALREFLTLGWVAEPQTLFADVRRVPAGTVLECTHGHVTHRPFWMPDAHHGTARAPSAGDLLTLLREAVDRQVVADVPVGVFTSGGLDSSLLAALAVQRLGREHVTTFSVGFPERSYDERPPARRIAARLGTRHVEVVADREALAHARARARRTAEPIADPALLPTILLAERARRDVGVVLSGEGADELFGGYPTYLGHRHAERYAQLPAGVRRLVRRAVHALPASDRKVSLEFLLKRFVDGAERHWYRRHVAWYGSGLDGALLRLPGPGAGGVGPPGSDDPVRAAMQSDYTGALRNRLLVKVDRATMLASLEARAPYLDRAVTRAALAIPAARHVGRWRTKRVLREAAASLLPSGILRRVKRGLSVPVADWLRGELAGECDRLLAQDRLDAQGLLHPEPVTRLLAEHRRGAADHGRALWTLLTLQDWIEHWGPEIGR